MIESNLKIWNQICQTSWSLQWLILGLSLDFSPETSEGNLVGVILVKGIGCTLIETDVMTLGLSIGSLLDMRECSLLVIPAGGR